MPALMRKSIPYNSLVARPLLPLSAIEVQGRRVYKRQTQLYCRGVYDSSDDSSYEHESDDAAIQRSHPLHKRQLTAGQLSKKHAAILPPKAAIRRALDEMKDAEIRSLGGDAMHTRAFGSVLLFALGSLKTHDASFPKV